MHVEVVIEGNAVPVNYLIEKLLSSSVPDQTFHNFKALKYSYWQILFTVQ